MSKNLDLVITRDKARHWSEADREAHEEMGFAEGWGLCTSQLAEAAARL
jgi:uncharacterized protein YndB with AHSA1/START domain